ncbi:MAG TPA: PDZ domain-containing protein [Sphingobium sp.]
MADPATQTSSDPRYSGAAGPLIWAGLLILSASPLVILTRMPSTGYGEDMTIDASGMTLADMGPAHDVVVTSVRTGGPAERSGLTVGDRLSAIGGKHPADWMMARHWLNERASCRIRINFLRDGAPIVATLDRCTDDRARNGTQDTGRRG